MDILAILTTDYQKFPLEQTFNIYAENVYFKDPLTEFRGVKQYQKMIKFMATWFKDIHLELQEIKQEQNLIYTKWILHWTTPLPWQPRITIPGHSELTLNEANLIISHVDYWECSPWDVLKQHLLHRI